MRYFKPSEFRCVCKHDCGLGFAAMDQDFLDRLEMARMLADVPFRINSAVRCEAHNRDVDGSENSSHLTGHAVDIRAESSHMRFKIIYGLIKAGVNRIGVYETFIHADMDPTKVPGVVWCGDHASP